MSYSGGRDATPGIMGAVYACLASDCACMSELLLNSTPTLRGALALELSAPAADCHLLSPAQAGALAQRVARDLAGLDEGVAALSLSTVGAHYDVVELLRPGWPLFTELEQLSARAPGQAQARIIAFGASAGRLPGALTPSDDHFGGPLRVVPFVLRGEMEAIARVCNRFEQDLVERGMASAETALMAQEVFAANIEHARYLTVHDLCALTALQYEHAGIAPLWPIIETALLSPGREVWLDVPPEPLLGWRAGAVEMVDFSDAAWHARYAVGLDADAAVRLHRHFSARQRQLRAVLMAHGIPVRQ